MIQIDLPALVNRLNILSKQSLELAAAECIHLQAIRDHRRPGPCADADDTAQ